MSTNERDELAERIAGRILVDLGAVVVDGDAADAAHNIAALVEELGYRKPRTITTAEEWEFLNAHDFWVKANPNNPEESARNNAAYFGTNRVRSREVTYTEWVEL